MNATKMHDGQGGPPGRVQRGAKFEPLDAFAVVGLLVAAFVARRNVLPHDGLFGDDAWQAFGAAKGSPGNFITVGFSAPGFTGALMIWHRLVGAPERMAYLAFAGGVVTPAVLYVALRRFGYVWSISLLLGAALVSENLNVVYSGRVKSYVIDALIVLGFAALLPRLVRVRFGWRAAALWVFGSFVVGFFSPFAFVAAGVAGMIMLLRPAGDRAMRAVAVVGQGALYIALTLAVRRTYDVRSLQVWWKRNYDAFVGFDVQPLGFVSHVVTHMRRVAAVFSGGPAWWATLILIAALIALAVDAVVRRRSARALRAQYLLLLMLMAVAASVVSVLPLGPTSDGMRLSLWLVPIFAIGVASALERLRVALTNRVATRIAFDAAAVVASALLVVSASNGGPDYPLTGSRTAAQFMERALVTNDAVFIEHTGSMYPYAIASHLHLIVWPQHRRIAFRPEFRDRRFHYIGFTGNLGDTLLLTSISDADHRTDIARAIERADRVFLYVEAISHIPRRGRLALATTLDQLGFKQGNDTKFGDAHVIVWRRTPP
ncbi:MAG: hypothetical protein M3Q30_11350 [Actinomycetota bacterium]|nr:hypothetical protein [Actinomycetota bacterium]